MFVSSDKAALDQLAAVLSLVLNTATPTHSTVHLAQGAFAPVRDSDPTTFTEATFGGYAAITMAAWETPYLLGGGQSESIPTTICHWSPTDTVTPNTITGYWIMGANGDYLGGEAFGNGVPMLGPTNALNLVPTWQIPPSTFSAVLVP